MNVQKTTVLTASQEGYFPENSEEHDNFTVFNSGDRIQDPYRHMDILPSFRIVNQIGRNDSPRDSAAQILKNMQQRVRISAAKTRDLLSLLFTFFSFIYFLTFT